MESNYRPCVLAVITNRDGMVLVGERVEPPGSWQFPQGGIDAGESPETAVRRELLEEVGITDFFTIGRSESYIRYNFPPEISGPLAKKYRGQDQIWFHLRLPTGHEPSLERATDKEFRALAWVPVAEVLQRVVEFKLEAYKQGLRALGLLTA